MSLTWKYSLGAQELVSPSGESWNAVSGRFGEFDALPIGNYVVKKAFNYITDKNFYDKVGNIYWFCPIQPTFSTNRTSLGIHPDGGVLGTQGCIGITVSKGKSTARLYELLKRSAGESVRVLA